MTGLFVPREEVPVVLDKLAVYDEVSRLHEELYRPHYELSASDQLADYDEVARPNEEGDRPHEDVVRPHVDVVPP